MQISPIDLAILVLYLAGITLFGAYFRRGQNSLRDYFLGGRTAPWWAIACPLSPPRPRRSQLSALPDCLRRKPRISANRAGLSCRARDSVCRADPAVFPRRILHGLSASRKEIWDANAVGGSGSVPGYPRACGRRSNIGHRKGGERRVRDGRTDFHLDYRGVHFVLYV